MHLTTILFAITLPLLANDEPPATTEPGAESGSRSASIAWYGTWESGVAEARRTGLPILLMSAAPRCHDVPGLW